MDLWIRSQNRKDLTKIEKFYVDIDGEIYGYAQGLESVKLGEYKTRERALEVLDEIQSLLISSFIVKCTDIGKDKIRDFSKSDAYVIPSDTTIETLHRDCIVFEMPEE